MEAAAGWVAAAVAQAGGCCRAAAQGLAAGADWAGVDSGVAGLAGVNLAGEGSVAGVDWAAADLHARAVSIPGYGRGKGVGPAGHVSALVFISLARRHLSHACFTLLTLAGSDKMESRQLNSTKTRAAHLLAQAG